MKDHSSAALTKPRDLANALIGGVDVIKAAILCWRFSIMQRQKSIAASLWNALMVFVHPEVFCLGKPRLRYIWVRSGTERELILRDSRGTVGVRVSSEAIQYGCVVLWLYKMSV